MRSGGTGNRQGRQDASTMGQDLLLGNGGSRGDGVDSVIRVAGFLPCDGCGVQFLFGVRSLSPAVLERHVPGWAAEGSGLGGCGDHNTLELPVVPDGFSKAAGDASGSGSGWRTSG